MAVVTKITEGGNEYILKDSDAFHDRTQTTASSMPSTTRDAITVYKYTAGTAGVGYSASGASLLTSVTPTKVSLYEIPTYTASTTTLAFSKNANFLASISGTSTNISSKTYSVLGTSGSKTVQNIDSIASVTVIKEITK